jgi:hypothetical protein
LEKKMRRVRKVRELNLQKFANIVFVNALHGEEPSEMAQLDDLPPEFHSDGRLVSVCARYVMWLYGAGSRVDNVARHVEIWAAGDTLYFYKSRDRVCHSVVIENASKVRDLFEIYDTFGTIVVNAMDMLPEIEDLLENTQVVVVRPTELKAATEFDACLERHPKLTLKCECLKFRVQNHGQVKHKNRVQISRAEFSDADTDLSAARACLARLSEDVRQVVNVKYG